LSASSSRREIAAARFSFPQPNDLVYSRDEHDPFAPIKAMLVEEKFERTGRILHLHMANGVVIRTTLSANGIRTTEINYNPSPERVRSKNEK